MYINPLGTEISQNHLSILKWSLNKYWGWKVWTLSFQMPCRTHFSESWMQRSIISNEKVSYLYLGVLPENRWMSFLHSTSQYSLRKSLKDLSDHLNFFVSCQGRSQLSPAIFRASRNHLVASKHSYMLKLSKSGVNGKSVQVNMAYDLIYITEMFFTQFPSTTYERNRFQNHIIIFIWGIFSLCHNHRIICFQFSE